MEKKMNKQKNEKMSVFEKVKAKVSFRDIKTQNNLPTLIITIVAVIARFVAFIFANPAFYQHDVMINDVGGHFDYAMHIFNNWHLADNNYYEFAQPPLNAILQAIFMKFIFIFKDYGDDYIALYTNCKVLSLIYSLIILYLFYKIINEFDLKKSLATLFYGIMALYPGLIIMTTQYSNDLLSYVFFYLSIYLCIRWAKAPKFSTIILLALSIGFGMLTKISVGLVAFIVGPMMLAVLIHSIKESKHKESLVKKLIDGIRKKKDGDALAPVKPQTIVLQLLVFLVIVTPLGLSYGIRNYMLFGQSFTYISEDIVRESIFALRGKNYSDIERYWSFAFSKLYDGRYDIFHDYTEYNIWVDLVKTSAFDEFQFRDTVFYPVLVVVWLYNILFYFVSTIAIIYNVVTLILAAVKKEIENIAWNILNLRLLSIMLYVLAMLAFLLFNMNYPYSCNSNFRYVAYIIFALAGNLIVLVNDAPIIRVNMESFLNKLFDEDKTKKAPKTQKTKKKAVVNKKKSQQAITTKQKPASKDKNTKEPSKKKKV